MGFTTISLGISGRQPVDKIVLSVADANSGIDLASLSIKANLIVNGHAADTELSGVTTPIPDGIYQINLNQPLPADATERHILAEISAYLVHMWLTGYN